MPKKNKHIPEVLVHDDLVADKIYFIRGQKVMLDKDLAELYGVETRVLKQAVRRNLERFPKDFMFELTKQEHQSLRSHSVTIKRGEHSKYLPFAFTEHGILMLSSVLNSKKAIQVNIQIMRIFMHIREMMLNNKDVLLEVEKLKQELATTKGDVRKIFEVLKQLIYKEETPKRQIGFKAK